MQLNILELDTQMNQQWVPWIPKMIKEAGVRLRYHHMGTHDKLAISTCFQCKHHPVPASKCDARGMRTVINVIKPTRI